MWNWICQSSSGPLTTGGLLLRTLSMAFLVFAIVTWFMIPAADRSRVRIAPNWKQRDAFASAKHFHLFMAGTVALLLDGVLWIIIIATGK